MSVFTARRALYYIGTATRMEIDVSLSPAQQGFRMPAEWQPHQSTWVAWPAAADLWGEQLGPAQRSFVGLCAAIAASPDPEPLEVLAGDASSEALARRALVGLPARFHRVPYGDIWLRDIAPIFLRDPREELAAACFAFNGWGGKYALPHDAEVARRIAAIAGTRVFAIDLVLEGGSIEVDGEGTCLTTRQCLLNRNRNPGRGEEAVASRLKEALGVHKVLWLDEGLANDHTDGHVDTLARFVAPGVVACMAPAGADDPNRAVLDDIRRALASFTDAQGRRLRVVEIPSPGRVEDAHGALMPASFANFYIARHTVVVPTYDVAHDEAAVRAVGALFPSRRAVGVPARALLTGGGAFHCITQQQPASAVDARKVS